MDECGSCAFIRFVPAAILIALTVFLFGARGLDGKNILERPTRLTWIASITHFRNLARDGWETKHLWSLALEEQFYFVWPIAFVLFRKHRLALIATVIVCCTACRVVWTNTDFRDIFDIFQRPDLRLDTFLIGGALALYPLTWCRKIPAVLAVTAFALWTPLSLTFKWTRPFDTPVDALLLTIGIWWLIKNPRSPMARYLSTRFMVVVGTLSYSLYLWQEMFLGPHIAWWSLPVLAIVACASYWIVEKPFLRLRERTSSARRVQPQRHPELAPEN